MASAEPLTSELDVELVVESVGKVRHRHKMEERLLQQRIKALAKNKALSKAAVEQQAADLEREMRERHARELEIAEAAEAAEARKEAEPVAASGGAAGGAAGGGAGGGDAAESAGAAEDGTGDGDGDGDGDGGECGDGGLPKPSRAQLRRERRKLGAEERAAAVAAAKAGARDPRQEELDAINAGLARLGRVVHKVAADGNCLFRAVEDQLTQNGEGGRSHTDLRRATAAYIRARPREFGPFLHFEAGDEYEVDAARAVDRYCDRLAGTPLWGGQPELRALAHLLERPILVHQEGGAPLEMGSEFRGRPLHLSFHRRYYALGEHYNSVRAQTPGHA